MAAQIRPNRLDVTDRFPMLGFTIRTDSPPRVAEVVLATDPALFVSREGRSPSSFYSSREHGPLSIPRGEAIYIVPPNVMARFIQADRLYFGLATATPPTATDWHVETMPTAESPYISLTGLSDRALRRVRMFPARRGSGYGARNANPPLEWAGDRAQPGTTPAPAAPQPVSAAPVNVGGGAGGNAPTPGSAAAPSPVPADVPYDDGFGPLPPLQPSADAEQASGAPASGAPAPAAQSYARGLEVDPEQMGIEGPIDDSAPAPHAMAFGTRPRALTAAEYSGVTRIMPSPAYNNGRRGQAIDRIVIHITGAPQSPHIGSWFTREEANSSAHYMVDQNGEIIQFVREQDTAWHARGANRRSIGIEHVAIQREGARYGNRTYPHTPPTDAEYRASAQLVAHLCLKYGLAPDRTTIIGHREADPRTTHTSCPDGAWDWDLYMALVAECHAALPSNGAVAQGLSASYSVSADRRSVPAPSVRALSMLEKAAVEAALAATPFGPMISAARLAAAPLGLSVAVGPAVGGGLSAGASFGAGVIFAPNGDLGLYGLAEFDVGAIFSLSATAQITILRGGIDAFSGVTLIATVSGGEGVVGGVSALFDTSGGFIGITVEGGVGIGEPVSIYVGIQRSISTTLGQSLGRARPMVVAMDANAISVSGEQQRIGARPVETMSQLRSIAIQALLASNPALTPIVLMARAGAEAADLTIGIGPQVSAGLLGGGGLGAGIIFAPGNVMGVYGSAEIDAGFIASIGANLQVTIVRGGIDAFRSVSYGAAISGGEGITGGAAALFDENRNFQGVTMQVGIGASLSPVDIYTSVSRSIATQLGMAMAMGGQAVEIKYRVFIPAPVIKGPMSDYDPGRIGLPGLIGGEDFGGDGRSFSYNAGTSRGEITATLTLGADGSISDLRTVNRHWGESTAYDSSYTYHVDGKPDWWLDKHAGLEPSRRSTLAVSDDNLRIYQGAGTTTRSILAVTSQSSVVSIYLAGNLPLISPSPDIDADISIYLRNGATGIEAMVVGDHDGFPAHELYINGQLVYSYDPVAAGNGPDSLMPPTDREISTDWIAIGARAGAGAQSLALAQPHRRFPSPARGMSGEIPLDPGVGGMSIGADALQIGDIILSTTSEAVSRAIRVGSGAEVSHAMLYVGQGGQVIEAIGDGVVLRPLEQALAHSNLAVAFRVPGLSDADRQLIADAAAGYLDLPYNYLGVVRWAGYHVDAGTCSLLPNGIADRCRQFVGRLDLGPGTTDSFFCSQLVLQAFADVGKALTVDPPHWASPGDIAQLRMREGALAYVGHLKAPIPSNSFFGVSLGTIARVRGLSRAMGDGDWSINWDEVQKIPQPTDKSCWATAAAMLVGWRDRMSVSPELLARFHDMDSSLSGGLAPADKRAFADAIGLVVHPNACYTAEGFRDILEANGPVWVTAKVPGVHAVVVTGMYRENGRDHVRITDPWDRVVGSPGAPGSYASTHNTGSQYIMTYEDFAGEFEAAGDIDRIQLLHNGGTFGHQANRGSASAAGYAQALNNGAAAPASSSVAPSPNGGGNGGDTRFGVGTSLTRTTADKNGRRYDLARLSGFVQPQNALASGAGMPAQPGERVLLDDWPYIEGPSGRTQAGVAVDWQYRNGAVGQITITPIEGQVLDGWTASVRADIMPNGSTPDRISLKVRVTTTFSRAEDEDQVAITDVTLSGDGRQSTLHGADHAPEPTLPNGGGQPQFENA
jgi:N-acetyl-anhydromuramyl-L-alanine amidase AmpD